MTQARRELDAARQRLPGLGRVFWDRPPDLATGEVLDYGWTERIDARAVCDEAERSSSTTRCSQPIHLPGEPKADRRAAPGAPPVRHGDPHESPLVWGLRPIQARATIPDSNPALF